MKYKVFLPYFVDSHLREEHQLFVNVFETSERLKKGQKICLFVHLPSDESVPMAPVYTIERIERIEKDVMNLFLKKFGEKRRI